MKKVSYDKIRTYFKLNKKPFIVVWISGLLFDGLMCLVPIFQGKLIDSFKVGENITSILRMALFFLFFVMFVQVNRFLKRYYVRDFSNRIVLQMRTVSFDNLLHNDIVEFFENSKGDIMNKILADIKDSAEGIRKVLTEFFDSIVLMSGYFVSMMIMDYQISLIVLVFFVASILLSHFLRKFIYKSTVEYKKIFSKNKDTTINALNNEVYYRGFGVFDDFYRQYSDGQNALEKASIKCMIWKGSLEPIYHVVALMGLFFVVYGSGIKVIEGIWPIGTFSAYLTTFLLVATKASKVGKVFNAYTVMRVSWKRCAPYLVTKKESKEIILTDKDSGLVVEHLTFGISKSFVLKDISFQLKKNETLGICGMIHSGKSTLGAALSGVYDYEGCIKLEGVELKEVRQDSGDGFISYIPSKVEIFNDSIMYNIAFEEASVDRELEIACLTKLTEGISQDDILSHSIGNLSGGQQKRLQIARGIYSNPKLLVMDDPFNAIDLDMGVKILKNIRNLYKDTIVVLVNNQPEILREMDYVLFLTKDSYFYGTYEELKENKQFNVLMKGAEK